MKVVILAGGLGTRISEESHLKPKPMIEIGDAPILWHIMKCYSYYGFNDFIICCGYKGHVIKEYFANYYLHRSDVTFDFTDDNSMTVHNNVAEPWKVTLVDSGLRTQTGGRIKRVEKYIDDDTFMMTYGDGVSDLNISDLLSYHNSHNKICTMTAVQPGGRYGVLELDEDSNIMNFTEKSKDDGGWINGGFMVLNRRIFDYLENDETILEREPLEKLAREGEVVAYRHNGFWQCMDTMRDKTRLDVLLMENRAPWVKW